MIHITTFVLPKDGNKKEASFWETSRDIFSKN